MSGCQRAVGRGVMTVSVALALCGATGCTGGRKTHPVKGTVVVADGDLQPLVQANAYVEFQLEGDPRVRGYSPIQEDGSFDLRTMDQGKKRPGVFEGTYQARILFPEPSGEGPRPRHKALVHASALDFSTSGLTFKVPADGDITLTIYREKMAEGKTSPARSAPEAK